MQKALRWKFKSESWVFIEFLKFWGVWNYYNNAISLTGFRYNNISISSTVSYNTVFPNYTRSGFVVAEIQIGKMGEIDQILLVF